MNSEVSYRLQDYFQFSQVEMQLICFWLTLGRLAKNLLCFVMVFFLSPVILLGEELGSFSILSAQYDRSIRPLLQQFCLGCHSNEVRAGELDLEQFSTMVEVRSGNKVWLKVSEMLDNGEMPPEESKQPATQQRNELQGWVKRYLHAEALANAGDPGSVVLRRLSNAEYKYTIRDLTGIDLNPAREFPTDNAAGEGFTNVGDALMMSPALLRKYLEAAKDIAQHAVLLPDGFRFSMRSTQRDWTDEILGKIRQLYRKFVDSTDLGVGSVVGNINVHGDTRIGLAGRLPLEKYFAATLTERKALSKGSKTLKDVAQTHQLNEKYLGTLWSSLSGSSPSLLLDALRSRWRSAKPGDAAQLVADINTWQKGLWIFGPVGLIGRKGGPSRWMEPVDPLVTEQQLCLTIPTLVTGQEMKEVILSLVVTDVGDGNDHDFVVWQQPRLVRVGLPDLLLRDVRKASLEGRSIKFDKASTNVERWGLEPTMFGKHPNGEAIDDASLCVRAPSVITVRLPAYLAAGRDLVTTAVLEEATGSEGSVQVEVVAGRPTYKSGLLPSEVKVMFSRVTQLFSDHRNISFSRPILVGKNSSTTRRRIEQALDEYRRLFPAALCFTQIVPVDEVLTLTLFYREDDHLVRLMLDDEQRARIDRLWEELHFVSQSPLKQVTALELLLEVMAGNGLEDRSQYDAMEPLHELFKQRATTFTQKVVNAAPLHLEALVDFADRVYRRPLSPLEAEELRELYQLLRERELPHEEAFRLTLARVFVASPFLYRLEKAPQRAASAMVSGWELANRLSYFIWSSLPDEELRVLAGSGKLHVPEVLVQQAKRMLTDGRVRRLATEFACQWLHIHNFDSLEEKSKKYFPEFDHLRGDMYEESILFFTDLFQRDRSLLSILDADHTFLNEPLARFYGIEGVEGARWRRVEGIQQHGRGGILGLATTLAKQSGASRTSPILRGNWVSEVLLGERLPRPPKDVPQLPSEEGGTDGLTVRQLVAKHTSDVSCSSCHQKIDPFGFALERFNAIGRRRDNDMAGRPINTQTILPDGSEIRGLTGLRDYLLEVRRDAFLRQFCRKLVGYAIGRELQLSDEPLLSEIQEELAESNYRISVAVAKIVRSRQFREIRGRNIQLVNSR